uniref:Tyrosinase copper-binding domain-containing protein n=1 Tax=Acrobeloides nanus TaxID=290746 RepID=A0A914C941_9BILA
MPHHYIGGDLEDSPTATNDPMFLLHHGFVDLLWELWKQQKDRTCHIPAVLDDDIDGTYEYALRPRCSWEKPDCGSNYLFCDKSQGQEKPARCASKIKLGGNCEGLDERDEPCNKGICYRNRCIRDSKKNNIIDNTF